MQPRRAGLIILSGLFGASFLLGIALHRQSAGEQIASLPSAQTVAITAVSRGRVELARVDPAVLKPVTTDALDIELASKALDNADPAVRLEAAHELGERGDITSQQVLEQLLYDPERRVRVTAMDALSMRPTRAILDTLARALAHPDPRVRDLANELRDELLAVGTIRQE